MVREKTVKLYIFKHGVVCKTPFELHGDVVPSEREEIITKSDKVNYKKVVELRPKKSHKKQTWKTESYNRWKQLTKRQKETQ